MLFSLLEQLAKRHEISMLLPGSPDPAFVARYEAVGIQLLDTANPSDFDVFLVNTLGGASRVLQAKNAVPVVWWIHEPAFGLRQIEAGQIDTAAFAAAARIVFPTDWQVRELYRPWLRDGSWAVVSAAIPPIAGVARRRESDGRFRLLHVGSIELRKGQDVSIKAVLALDDPSLELRLVGADAGRWAQEGKRALARTGDPGRRVIWCGRRSPLGTLQEIADADALVFPTRDDLFALVVLEAMSLRVPVICSNYGALAEELRDGEEALLVPIGDHSALAAAIERLRGESGLAQRLVDNALSRVVARRPYDIFVESMERELFVASKLFNQRTSA